MENQQTATCPYCAEIIVKGATKCKHCGEWLQANPHTENFSPDKATQATMMQCKRCSRPVLVGASKCPSCGNNPNSLPIVTQIIIGLIIGPILGWLIAQLFF